MKLDKKVKKLLDTLQIRDELKNIILGIYKIESKYRKFYFRWIEYIFLIIEIILNKLFKRKIRNYTVGVFQIGLTSILNFYGYKDFNVHQKKIAKLHICHILAIIKGIKCSNNMKICVNKVNSYYEILSQNYDEYYTIVGIIGKLYNGSVGYGFALQELVQNIELNKISAV